MEPIVVSIVGYAVKTAFGLLFDATKRAYETAAKFPELHDNLSLTLETLKSLEPLIARLNQTGASSVSERFRKTMEDGKKLVEGCADVSGGSLNLLERRKYAKKIIHLENSLRGLWFHLHIQLEVNSAVVPSRTNANLVAQDQNQSLIPIGRKGHLDEMKKRLLSSNSPPMLVLTAPVGYGKTTLAIMFCRDQQVKAKFKDNIFFAIVSDQHSDLVVQELCQLDRFRLPASENGEIAARQNPLLLILDDVPLGSESLLERFNRIKIPDYKILVTSRYHFPKFGSPYELPELTDGDAVALFSDSAFLPMTSFNKDDFREESTKIVNHCKKFPPALTTIGRSLCNENIERWKLKCTQLSEGSIIESERCLQGLKSCLDDLINELAPIKDCFKDLGLFPKNQRVPVAALLDMWAELYKGSNDNASMANLYDLTYRNLASLVVRRYKDMDGYYGEHFVIQRDMLKLLSIHESGEDPIGHRLIIDVRGDKLPPWWTEKKQKTKKQKMKEARFVSVSTGESPSKGWDNMDLPEGEVLVLNFQEKKYTLPKFMETMQKLKVLMVTNDGSSPAELSNFELLCSLSNLKRLRLKRISIPLISMKKKKKQIQSNSVTKISLFQCNVRQAFGNPSIQFFETFPYLEELHIEYCDDLLELPAKLCDHSCLKVLIITDSHKLSALPEDIGNLKNLQVLRLRSCAGLEKLPGSIEKLGKLNFLDIYNCFSIKELPECIGKMKGLRKINMAKCSRLEVLPDSVYECDIDQQLNKVICDKGTRILWEHSALNPNKITVAKEEINLNWIPELQN